MPSAGTALSAWNLPAPARLVRQCGHMGTLIKGQPGMARASGPPTEVLAKLDLHGFATNLTAATLGNIVAGAAMIGLVYWFVYLRDADL